MTWLIREFRWWRLTRLQSRRRALLSLKRLGEPYSDTELLSLRARIDDLNRLVGCR